ncbi:competence type IV pilus minor pilin ComGF [Staphylococcus saprophyticus]|uniref:competence type IV pilus minor pilin ComGF n=1 Tax=Staphylococcus saprophyticus TaxID=29385 RepID=UPI0008533215|nr:competence type IV pilus minor pilin ComGF [Staphylococcus saprophyticus]MDT3966907.1 competence type IV pilus minor pilin ComGF [Staphylococcus saprophyticus]MDT3973695.1 competence type IV pilus minor pilin ComGF [Staphylococcus saprophyticus]MDT3978973.1 competence type IV pilus minor pilin ComGF [Staphylococcus saprophyticus]MDT3984961.1 competence type IV pilus minor pilin ComGF [Staphylococcus saprophyticus]MDT3997273.1 competence type IV pilus minor pilin ComGF [Staphylococcus saprop
MKNVSSNKFRAFTYIEVLFALFITILIFSILPTLIRTTGTINEQIMNAQEVDLAFFSRDLTQDLIKENAYVLKNQSDEHHIVIRNKQRNIIYEFKNNKLIKTLDGKGNITTLHNVVSAKFKIINDKSVVINFKIFKKGIYYEKKIVF